MANTAAEESEFTLWDVADTASATGLRPRYIQQIIAERRLPVVKIGRYVRVRPADVREFIRANTIPATPARAGNAR